VAPFHRSVTPPGASSCVLDVGWDDGLEHPLLVDPGWSSTAGPGNITGHATAVLPDGLIVVGPAKGAQIFSAGAFAVVASMNASHLSATATLLGDGRVLVAGGNTAACELYDPANGTWSNTAAMSASRTQHRAVRLNDGSVLVTGGDSVGTAE